MTPCFLAKVLASLSKYKINKRRSLEVCNLVRFGLDGLELWLIRDSCERQ